MTSSASSEPGGLIGCEETGRSWSWSSVSARYAVLPRSEYVNRIPRSSHRLHTRVLLVCSSALPAPASKREPLRHHRVMAPGNHRDELLASATNQLARAHRSADPNASATKAAVEHDVARV